MEVIPALDVEFYLKNEEYCTMFDNHLHRVIRPRLRPSSWQIICYMLQELKANHNDSDMKFHTYEEIMKGTGIKSRSTIWEAISELERGLKPLVGDDGRIIRPELTGFKLIKHQTGRGDANYYALNLEDNPHLFRPVGREFTQMHEALIRCLMLMLNGQQWSMFWYLWGQTIGWGKQVDQIPMSQFEANSGLSYKPAIQKTLKQLEDLELILIEPATHRRYGKMYRLNNAFLFVKSTRAKPYEYARQTYLVRALNLLSARAKPTECARQATPQNTALNNDLNKEKNKEKNNNTETTTLSTNYESNGHNGVSDATATTLKSKTLSDLQSQRELRKQLLTQLGVSDDYARKLTKLTNDDELELELISQLIEERRKNPNLGVGFCVKVMEGKAEFKLNAPTITQNGNQNGLDPAPKISDIPPWEAEPVEMRAPAIDPTIQYAMNDLAGQLHSSLLMGVKAEKVGNEYVLYGRNDYQVAQLRESRVFKHVSRAFSVAARETVSVRVELRS